MGGLNAIPETHNLLVSGFKFLRKTHNLLGEIGGNSPISKSSLYNGKPFKCVRFAYALNGLDLVFVQFFRDTHGVVVICVGGVW